MYKVKLSLCLTKLHAMKKYWVNGGVAPRIRRRHYMEVSGQLHTTDALLLGKEPLVLNGLEAWVGSTAGLNTVSKRKIASPRREANPDNPIANLV